MPKLHSPYIRIEITEVVETPGDSNRRESLYNLGYYEFQTREEALKWMKAQDSVGSFSQHIADAVNINI